MSPTYKNLAQAVQHNCHISDARHAGDYTLCIYLLKMREYYRWEQVRPFSESLSIDDIGNWLTQREDMWDQLVDEDYSSITSGNQQYDPFDSESINQHLLEQGLVYSGGIGHKAKPHFFLAELESQKHINGYQILVSSTEHARDLTAPPAMSQGDTIFIRRESFKRMIWEKTEEWKWNRPDNAMARAIACYDFENDIEGSLEAMTANELDAAVLHEIGEIRAGELLEGWSGMMQDIVFSQAEIMARAVRDHLADALSTLPRLLQEQNDASIHFYFSNLTHMRKTIFPSLLQAYQQWLNTHDTKELNIVVKRSQPHWHNIATKMLTLHNTHAEKCRGPVEALVNSHHL